MDSGIWLYIFLFISGFICRCRCEYGYVCVSRIVNLYLFWLVKYSFEKKLVNNKQKQSFNGKTASFILPSKQSESRETKIKGKNNPETEFSSKNTILLTEDKPTHKQRVFISQLLAPLQTNKHTHTPTNLTTYRSKLPK